MIFHANTVKHCNVIQTDGVARNNERSQGVVQSLVGGQPLLIVGVAEPIILIYAFMYEFAIENGIPYRPWCSVTLFWAAGFILLLSASNPQISFAPLSKWRENLDFDVFLHSNPVLPYIKFNPVLCMMDFSGRQHVRIRVQFHTVPYLWPALPALEAVTTVQYTVYQCIAVI